MEKVNKLTQNCDDSVNVIKLTADLFNINSKTGGRELKITARISCCISNVPLLNRLLQWTFVSLFVREKEELKVTPPNLTYIAKCNSILPCRPLLYE
jgi:hypothetical protein